MAKKNQLTTSDYLEYSEYQRMVQCLHDHHKYLWELYARLAFCTACRAYDVLHLRWEQILSKKNTIIEEHKTKKARNLFFNDTVSFRIQRLYEALGSPDPSSYIFQSKRTGEPITIQHLNRVLKDIKFKYKVKIDNFSTHTFRKTFGRYVYETNGRSAESLVILNKILNHSSIQVTKTYIGITQDEINDVFASIKF